MDIGLCFISRNQLNKLDGENCAGGDLFVLIDHLKSRRNRGTLNQTNRVRIISLSKSFPIKYLFIDHMHIFIGIILHHSLINVIELIHNNNKTVI